MSLTMQHIISDAQTLCTRLKDHESLADRLISQAQSLYKQVDAMKQYEEEVGQLNEVAHQKPRDALVQGIQQENRHLRELQQENKELRNSLEEHQNTLEIVMSNYRKQVTQLMEVNRADRQLQRSQPPAAPQAQGADAALLERQADKIQEMASVMRRALELDERSEHRAQQAIAQLTSENRGLRELLRVTYRYSAGPAPPAGDADCSHSSGSLPDSPCTQTVRRRPGTSPQGSSPTSPGRSPVQAGSVESRAPPRVPALVQRGPVSVRSPTAAAASPTTPPAQPALSTPQKGGAPPAGNTSPEKQTSQEAQLSPQKAESTAQPPAARPGPKADSPPTAN